MKALPYVDAVVHVRREILSNAPIAPLGIVMRCVYPGGMECAWHTHSTAIRRHAILILSGAIIFQERGKPELLCEAGSVLVIPTKLDIRWKSVRDATTIHALHSDFDFNAHGALASLFGPLQERMIQVKLDVEFARSFERKLQLMKNARMKDVGYSVMIFDMLWAALEAQRSNPLNAVDASPTPLVKCLDYIENNLHRNISLADLMKSSALGASRLTQLFRENLGAPPLHYVAKRKMDIAERLIASSGASISEIAARLGFKSLSYFSRVFKRVKGEAPSEIIAKK